MSLATARGPVMIGTSESCKELLGACPAAPAIAGYALACDDPAALKQRLEALGRRVNPVSPELCAAALPPALGGAWLFGTRAGLETCIRPLNS